MARTQNWRAVVSCVAMTAGALLAPQARGAAPLILLDGDLTAHQVSVQSLRDGMVSYFDADGQFKSDPLTRFLQIRGVEQPAGHAPAAHAPAAGGPAAAGGGGAGNPVVVQRLPNGFNVVGAAQVVIINGVVVAGPGVGANNNKEKAKPAAVVAEDRTHQELGLVDGEVLPGKMAGASEDGQKIHWTSPRLGELTVNLEKVKYIRFTKAAVGTPPATDELLLENGDKLTGFVTAVNSEELTIQPQGDGASKAAPVTVKLENVRTMVLANPLKPVAAQSLVRLRDGTRVLVTKFEIDADQLKLTPVLTPAVGGAATAPAEGAGGAAGVSPVAAEGGVVSMGLGELERVDLTSGGERLVSLTDLEEKVVSGGTVFAAPEPPRVSGAAWLMHAPVTSDFALPDNVQRFAMTAELAADLADPATDWTDMKGDVLVDGKSVAHFVINHGSPKAAINVPCTGLTLTVRLETGANGPVMDRLRLKDAVVLVKEGK